MSAKTPEPLWREVVGDTEPWRRGRLFLVLLAVWQFLSQLLVLSRLVLAGHIDLTLTFMVAAIVSWLSFYFIWTGVHWVRWVAGGLSCLAGFARIIWGVRDGSGLLVLDGAIAFATGAYLALAPSVYFFALRQKEKVRWKESLAVGAIFTVLIASTGITLFALSLRKSRLEEQAHSFADRAFQAVFVKYDTEFLRAHASQRLLNETGWDRLSAFTTDAYVRVGAAQELEAAQGRLLFRMQFPTTPIAKGVVTARARGERGPVRLFARIGTADGDWEIDAIWWRYLDANAAPLR